MEKYRNLNLTILPDIYSSETSWTLETADADKSNLLTDVKSNIEVIHVGKFCVLKNIV